MPLQTRMEASNIPKETVRDMRIVGGENFPQNVETRLDRLIDSVQTTLGTLDRCIPELEGP